MTFVSPELGSSEDTASAVSVRQHALTRCKPGNTVTHQNDALFPSAQKTCLDGARPGIGALDLVHHAREVVLMKRYTMLASALMMSTMLAAGAAHEKSLVYCSEGSPENFTPAINTTGTSLDAARPVFNKLVQFTPGTTKVEPGLAEKWEVSKDGLTLTFHLRKGVKFHSGVNGFTPTRDF